MIFKTVKESSRYKFSSLLPCTDDFSQMITITDELIMIYTNYSGELPRAFHLVNDYSNNRFPMTRRDINTIFVNCPTFYANQFLFQLSHELCHWMIPSDVPTNLRWIEESFSVLASIFFPPLLESCPNDYSDYAFNSSSQIAPLCVKTPSFPNSNMVSILETGSGTDNFNDYGSYYNIAVALHPLFAENPILWKSIHVLSKIPSGLPFNESLEMYCTLATPDTSRIIREAKEFY